MKKRLQMILMMFCLSIGFALLGAHNVSAVDGDADDDGVPDARERLAEAYLTPWTTFEPMPRLLEAYAAVKLLSPLYTSLQYAFDIFPRMEMRWEMENMLAYNLRLLLRESA